LNFDFIVAEIWVVFRSVGVYVCVCLCDPIGLHDKSAVFYLISVGFEIVAAAVFCSAKAQFWMIYDAILIPKIYARLQEIASNFSKKNFLGGGPQTPRRRSRLRRSVFNGLVIFWNQVVAKSEEVRPPSPKSVGGSAPRPP